MQVKDLTKNENEKVFIFNGWTFASDPSLTPFDHAIYDLQLLIVIMFNKIFLFLSQFVSKSELINFL
jgi:hypothetical protein